MRAWVDCVTWLALASSHMLMASSRLCWIYLQCVASSEQPNFIIKFQFSEGHHQVQTELFLRKSNHF